MRIEAILWTGTAVFFVGLATIYMATGGSAAPGTLLAIAFLFGALVAGWLWRWVTTNEPRAEDRADADMADEVGDIGTFVTHSWRPIAFAAGAIVAALGLVIGPWLTLIGIAMILFNAIATASESP